MKKIAILLLLIAMGMNGCFRLTYPKLNGRYNELTIWKDSKLNKDAIYDEVIDLLTDRGIVAENMDKASGYISVKSVEYNLTKEVKGVPQDPSAYFVYANPTPFLYITYNLVILIRPTKNGSSIGIKTIPINAYISSTNPYPVRGVVASLGNLEKEILNMLIKD